jgi:maltodextrin utilization protein YvdJ
MSLSALLKGTMQPVSSEAKKQLSGCGLSCGKIEHKTTPIIDHSQAVESWL